MLSSRELPAPMSNPGRYLWLFITGAAAMSPERIEGEVLKYVTDSYGWHEPTIKAHPCDPADQNNGNYMVHVTRERYSR